MASRWQSVNPQMPAHTELDGEAGETMVKQWYDEVINSLKI